MTGELTTLIGGLAAAMAVVLPALRKRQDVDVDEFKARISDLTTRLSDAEVKIGELQGQLVRCEEANFAMRRSLAQNGIAVPTEVVEGA